MKNLSEEKNIPNEIILCSAILFLSGKSTENIRGIRAVLNVVRCLFGFEPDVLGLREVKMVYFFFNNCWSINSSSSSRIVNNSGSNSKSSSNNNILLLSPVIYRIHIFSPKKTHNSSPFLNTLPFSPSVFISIRI